jgi:putative hydrolase of the HAD superfamily
MMPKDMLRALRFARTLRHFGVEDGRLARTLEDQYLERCPKRGVLMPGALRLLEDLYPHYHLHIITNGFTEVQMQKLDTTGIRRFFKVVLTSEMAGVAKPAAGIFRHALRAAGAQVRASLMIGDNARSDMAGARDAGLDQAHLSPQGTADPEATYRVEALDQLRPLLLADHLPSGTNT